MIFLFCTLGTSDANSAQFELGSDGMCSSLHAKTTTRTAKRAEVQASYNPPFSPVPAGVCHPKKGMIPLPLIEDPRGTQSALSSLFARNRKREFWAQFCTE